MAFKLSSARLASIGKLAAIGRRAIVSLSQRKWVRAPLTQGVGAALLLAIALYGWLSLEARKTYSALDAANPPAIAMLEVQPAAAEAVTPKDETPEAAPVPAGSNPDLIEQTQAGPLPRIGTDGTAPWRAYAQSSDVPKNKPRIAILVNGLGVSAPLDRRAVRELPEAVTLGVLAFAERIVPVIADARAEGHEVVLSAPMEPDDYPANDPGPDALLIKADDNVARLDRNLARGGAYVGVAPFMGSRFTASPEPLRPVLAELAGRGLLYIDTGSAAFGAAPAIARAIGAPIAVADRTIDRMPDAALIDKELSDLESLARRKGWALGVASPYPVTFDRLAAWSATLEAKGIALVPVSAVAQTPRSSGS